MPAWRPRRAPRRWAARRALPGDHRAYLGARTAAHAPGSGSWAGLRKRAEDTAEPALLVAFVLGETSVDLLAIKRAELVEERLRLVGAADDAHGGGSIGLGEVTVEQPIQLGAGDHVTLFVRARPRQA